MIKKSLEAYFFTLKNKIVFCKKQFQNMSVFCFYWQHTPLVKNYIAHSTSAATTATTMISNRGPQPEPLPPPL